MDDKANGFQWGGRLTSFSANFKFAAGYNGSGIGSGFGTDSDGDSSPIGGGGAEGQAASVAGLGSPVASLEGPEQGEERVGLRAGGLLAGARGQNLTLRHSLAELVSECEGE